MTRRTFILLSLLSSTGALRGARPGTWALRLSTASLHFRELSLEDACAQVAALGYEGIDVWSGYENCPHLDAAAQLGGDGLAQLLHRHHLQLSCISTYVGGYSKYARLLGELGGGLAVQGSAGPCGPDRLTQEMKAFFESLKPLAELAERHNSRLAIENHGHTLLNGLDSLKAFVDLNPFDRVGVALAPYHLQAESLAVPEAIRICGRQLMFFYAWQHAEGIRQLPGHGPADFGPWLSALAEIGYKGYVNAFRHGHAPAHAMTSALTKAREYLSRCAPRALGLEPGG